MRYLGGKRYWSEPFYPRKLTYKHLKQIYKFIYVKSDFISEIANLTYFIKIS